MTTTSIRVQTIIPSFRQHHGFTLRTIRESFNSPRSGMWKPIQQHEQEAELFDFREEGTVKLQD